MPRRSGLLRLDGVTVGLDERVEVRERCPRTSTHAACSQSYHTHPAALYSHHAPSRRLPPAAPQAMELFGGIRNRKKHEYRWELSLQSLYGQRMMEDVAQRSGLLERIRVLVLEGRGLSWVNVSRVPNCEVRGMCAWRVRVAWRVGCDGGGGEHGLTRQLAPRVSTGST